MEQKPTSSIQWLLGKIEEFLKNNPTISPEGFGWACSRDTSLVERLRAGGDVTTRKMDVIIAYLANPNQ
jgi:hypothetical protein